LPNVRCLFVRLGCAARIEAGVSFAEDSEQGLLVVNAAERTDKKAQLFRRLRAKANEDAIAETKC
jgi:hypothetical protein